MNPGVRAAGSVDRPTNPIGEACQRGFEFPLDCPDAGSLDLETGIVRAVVFNPCPIPLTGRCRGSALSSTWLLVR
jgi:hypothetical protein